MTLLKPVFSAFIFLMLTGHVFAFASADAQTPGEGHLQSHSASRKPANVETNTGRTAEASSHNKRMAARPVVIESAGPQSTFSSGTNSSGSVMAAQEPGQSKDGSRLNSQKSRENEPTVPQFEERMIIGVQCVEADEALRHHLRLSDCGLVVSSVRERTPADESRLQRLDILVKVDETSLTCRQDLIDAVQNSNGNPLRLQIVRAGQQLTVTVTPRKLSVPVAIAPALITNELQDQSSASKSQPSNVFPGLLFEGRLPSDDAEMQTLLDQLRELANQTASESSQGSGIILPPVNGVVHSKEEIQRTIQVLRRQIESLESQLKSFSNEQADDMPAQSR